MMRMAQARGRHVRGMSMVELVIVVAVTMVLAAILLPNIINTTYNIRLRSAANDVSGLLQQAHFRAIRDNTYYPVCSTTIGSNNRTTLFFIDMSATRNCSASWSNTYPTVQLGGNVTRRTSGYPAISSMSLGFTPLVASTSPPYFSSRGTPCSVNNNLCLNVYTPPSGTTVIAAYGIFLTDSRPGGGSGWSAVTVSPAGRVRTWMWDGSKWE